MSDSCLPRDGVDLLRDAALQVYLYRVGVLLRCQLKKTLYMSSSRVTWIIPVALKFAARIFWRLISLVMGMMIRNERREGTRLS